MSRAKKFIHDLKELYKQLLGVNEGAGKSDLPTGKTVIKPESIEETNSMDFLLEELEKEAEENRKKMRDLGFWTEE